MARKILPRLSFLLAGTALAVLIINGFLWYAAAQAPDPPYRPVQHRTCGQPVTMLAEDYNRWGGTRGEGIELARLDFCNPALMTRDDGRLEVWFWLEVEVTGQVFPYTGWGYAWLDVETPFPADYREPRNPWWTSRTGLRVLPNELSYQGGEGYACPHPEVISRGLTLFFYNEAGFQLPVGTRHSGWVCVFFDSGNTVPDSFTVSIQPDRARIIQWVDRVFATRRTPDVDIAPIPTIREADLCEFARLSHPETIRPGEACDS